MDVAPHMRWHVDRIAWPAGAFSVPRFGAADSGPTLIFISFHERGHHEAKKVDSQRHQRPRS